VVLSEPTAEDAEDLSTLDDAADAIVDDVSSTVDSAVDQATSTAGSVAGQAGSAIDAAVGTVESGVGTAVGAADSAYDAAVDGIDSAVDSAGNAIDSAASTVGGTVQVRASCVCACLPVGGWVCGAAVSGPCCCRSRICRRCRSRPGLAWPYLKRHPVCVCSMPAVGRGCCHQCDWQHLWLRWAGKLPRILCWQASQPSCAVLRRLPANARCADHHHHHSLLLAPSKTAGTL
jgi:hypothetical protein